MRYGCLQALSILSQALTDIQCQPGTEYLSKLCSAVQGRQKAFSLQQLSYFMNSFATFGHHPGSVIMDDTVAVAKDRLITDSSEL